MDILDQAQNLNRQGRVADAIALIRKGGQAGDADAQFALANWSLHALNGPRDLAKAHHWLAMAAAQDHGEALMLQATLLANGTGCRSDPVAALAIVRRLAGRHPDAARQIDLLARMEADAGWCSRVRTLHDSPHIAHAPAFLSAPECAYLVDMIRRYMQPSLVIDPATGQRIPNPVRTSSGASFGPTQENPLVHAINRRIAALTGTAVESGEPLHMLHYRPGQQYHPHLDALPGVENQRLWTVLLYLNDGYHGGETCFDRLPLHFAGRRGDALIFANLDHENRPDQRSRHAGLPVDQGEKWLATRWIRQAAYHPWA